MDQTRHLIKTKKKTFLIIFRCCFFVIALLSTFSVYGQEPQPKFRHFDVNDGLPSATVYHVYQDSKDYIWFSSEAGLTKFDGIHANNYSMDDGLPDNEVFGVFEDSRKRLWIKGYNGKFCYLKNNKVFNENNKPFLKYMQKKDWITNIQEDTLGNIYFAMQRSGVLILTPSDSIVYLSKSQLEVRLERFQTRNPAATGNSPKERNINVLNFKSLSDKRTLMFTNIGEFSIHPKTYEVEVFKLYDTEKLRVDLESNGDVWGIDKENTIYAYENFQFVPKFSNTDINAAPTAFPFHVRETGNIWVASLGSGVLLVENWNFDPIVSAHYLDKESVSWITRDREGNYWLSTLGKGVYMLPTNTVLTYTEKEGLSSNDLYSVTGDDEGNIYVGGKGVVNKIRKNHAVETVHTEKAERGYNRIVKILVDDKQDVWIGADMGATVLGKKTPYKGRATKNLAKDNQGNIFIGDGSRLMHILPNNRTKLIWKKRTTAILPEDNGVIWLGALDGLYYYGGEDREIVDLKKQNPLFGYRITDLGMTKDSVLCLCTFGNGLVLKDKEKSNQVSTKDGLVGNTCKGIFIDNHNNIWVSTNAGVSRFTINKQTLTISSPINYSESDNLASNDIRDIYAKDGKVWVATSEGLSFFAENEAKEEPLAPKIYITGFKIGEKDTTILPKYILPYNQNNITITYTGLSFKSGNRIRYKYKKVGTDDDWIISELNESQFPDLDPGHYTFLVKAISVDNIESEAFAKVEFIIKPPWWKTIWFSILLVLGVGGLISLIVYYIIQNNKHKDELRRQIVESEQMALRAQMNPHFIFNALNSIQHFITMEDEMSANYYLSKFSKLVRQVLENSKKTFVYLTEELETLELYLALEMLRFDEKFEYKLIVDEEINTYDIEIPSMIIQPFIENAIWHGLMPKNGDARLEIRFEETADFLICKIEDNGIGREASEKINQNRSAKHKSTGIGNTVKRLSLLSNVKHTEPLVQITDLKDGEKALGTLVTIKIPLVNEGLE